MIKFLLFLLILSSISYADIEEEIYSPEYEQESKSKSTEINYEKDILFKKLMTCVFKSTDYKRIFRFGITEDNNFFYRKRIKLNNDINGIANEKIFLQTKNNIYYLEISKNFEKLDLVIDFDKKKSKLKKNNMFSIESNCK